MEHCVYPPLPQEEIPNDDRTFTPGEVVCVKGPSASYWGVNKATYVAPFPDPTTGRISHHTIRVPLPRLFPDEALRYALTHPSSRDVGKYESVKSQTIINSLARQKNFPENIQTLLKRYVSTKYEPNPYKKGGKRNKKTRKNKQNKAKKTRKH